MVGFADIVMVDSLLNHDYLSHCLGHSLGEEIQIHSQGQMVHGRGPSYFFIVNDSCYFDYFIQECPKGYEVSS